MPTFSDKWLPIKGKPALHIHLSVPAANEEAADKLFGTHKAWMSSSHSIGAHGSSPKILEYFVSKGKELNDPMDPSKGETGNFTYCVSEVYSAAEDIPAHFANAEKNWAMLGKFKECIANFGKHVDVGSPVFTSFSDGPTEPCTAQVGDSCILISYTVPAAAEAEVDAFFVDHEKFMRSMHTFDKSADDAVTPRLTSFHISKCKELKDPMDPASGETGNIKYMMSESYVAPSGVQGHMAVAGSKWADGFKKFQEVTGKYATFATVGATTVVQTMH